MLKVQPDAQVHCFEICPPTFDLLKSEFGEHSSVVLNNFGLSDYAGQAEIKYSPESDGLTSTLDLDTIADSKTLSVRVERGDSYCRQAMVGKIDFMKIDVEGAEPRVLAGFGELVHPSRIPVVQFEYGRVNVEAKYLLKDFYRYFSNLGYMVGKLFPDGVRFREYSAWDEDFLGPNYVAVRPDLYSFLRSSFRS